MPKVQAFVEVTSGVVRAGPDAKRYGDPYEHAVSFASVDGRTAVLKGWSGKPPLAHLRAAKEALAALGLRMVWDRLTR